MFRGSTGSGVLTAALLVLAAPCSMHDAAASAGCDAVNAGEFKLLTRGGQKTKTLSGFVVGDVVILKVSCYIGTSTICDQGFWAKLTTGDGSEVSRNYRIAGQRQDNELTLTVNGPSSYQGFGAVYAEGTCTPAGE